MINIGFTGTRFGMTPKQKMAVADVVFHFAREYDGDIDVHHGCCVGADDEFHILCKWLGVRIWLHPPAKADLLVTQHFLDVPDERIKPAAPYLARNKAIVEHSAVLIATPKDMNLKKGGTWHTINAATEKNLERYVIAP